VEVATTIRTAAVTAEGGFAGAPSRATVLVGPMEVGVGGACTGSAAAEGAETTTAAVAAAAGVGMIPGLVVTATVIQEEVVAAEEEREEEKEEEEDRLSGRLPRRVRSPPPSRARVTSLTCWRWLGRKQPEGHRLRPRPRRRRRRRRHHRISLSFLPRVASQR
jgi:hypothetical protein